MPGLRNWSAVLVSGLMFVGVASAQEWTRFRGPNGTGLSETAGIPITWTEADYRFKAKLPAGGHSSPVLWGDLVFLTGADDTGDARRLVYAVDANTGRVVWTKTFESTKHTRHKLNSFASGTAAVDESRVYVSWTTPEEYTVKAFTHDGREIWSRGLGPYVSQHSGGNSPVVFDDLLIVVNDQDLEGGGKSFVTALNRETGERVWKLDRTSDVVAYSTPCEHRTADGIELIFNSKAHGITGVNPYSGKVNWTVGELFDKRSVSSSVVAAGDLLIGSCGSGAGGNYLVAVHPGTAAKPDSGKLAYKITRQMPYVPTPIAKGDLLFLWADNGIVSCVEAKSGDILWQNRVGGTFYGSPICVQNKLYAIDTTGTVVVLAADREFAELARNPLNDLCHSTPAVANGRLYLRTYEHLICLGPK
ncbi:MAG TPA: PQQ-binding-like beta-propeller repeat protein [Planctomycetaceae bacterium]|nr:PQQ-binding-like beta-propeller repeat protein [Planctomycetaceae bacterium]